MTTQLLATELANLVQESKRKHNDLRQAAEKSLEELKSLKGTNEAQATAELAQKATFVNPFIIACGTRNAKFTSIAIVCLQRLVVAKALPHSKLGPVLEALSQASSAGLDVQLKILQALPPLLTNYADDTSKNAIVNNTSAATLQQLIVAVFDKVVAEDKTKSLAMLRLLARRQPRTALLSCDRLQWMPLGHLSLLPSESGQALDILTHMLDQDTAVWKRALCMEVFRGIFSEPALIRRIFMLYDSQEGEKDVLKTLTATFAAKQEKDKESTEEAMDRSFKKTPIPVNPLEMKDHPLHEDIKACANIIDECWPAILATCSTFLNAALDSEYYHSLVRAFQRIAHVAGTLQQADFVLFSSGKVPGRTPIVNKIQDATAENEASTLLSNFGSEIRAVETAASRLIESTVDFPNDPFIQVVEAICALLEFSEPEAVDTETSTSDQLRSLEPPKAPHVRKGSTSSTSGKHRRVLSVSNVASVAPNQEDMFALAKLGDIATINIERLLAYDPETSGWEMLTKKLIGVLGSQNTSPSVRTRAADILVQLVLEAAKTVAQLEEGQRGPIQMNLFQALRNSLAPMKREQAVDLGLGSVASNATDVDIQRILLDGLKNILEICGETLVSGWEVAFEIIDSIFVYLGDKNSIAVANGLSTRSAKLVRPSFNSLQLICSDFLASLPNTCFLLLVDTLYKFSSQDDDLNIALTTVTFFWTLSDFLSSKNQALSITTKIMGGQDVAELAKMAADPENEASDAALWMLLLLRLAAVTADDRLELRNSAIQTLLRIFDAYGDKLSSEAWAVCVQSVIFKLLTSITSELALANDDDTDEQEREDWNVTASVVLEGISGLLANYLDALKADESFERLWKELLRHFAQFLDFKALSINTAVYKALSQIIVQPADGSLSTETISVTWELWARGTPQSKDETKDNLDNQECLQAYVSTLCDLYRFLHPDLAIERVKTMLVLLRQADRVLAAIKMIPFEDYPTSKEPSSSSHEIKKKRTFVALSKASMAILQDLILAHSTDSDIYKSGAFTTALRAFSRPITLKYQFPVLTRGVPAWKVATTAALAVLQNALNQPAMELEKASTAGIWAAIVDISDGIISADPSSVPESIDVMADQDFDISSFETLRDLIIPTLGNANISSETRDRFAQSLFTTSIMHELSEAESQALALPGTQALAELFKSRPGPGEADHTPSIMVVPPTPNLQASFGPGSGGRKSGGTSSDNAKNAKELRIAIASSIATFVSIRCALTMRMYIDDTPLRGRMPQPLFQRKELLHILARLLELHSEKAALPPMKNMMTQTRKHLVILFPLLVQTAQVAGSSGDEPVLKVVMEAMAVMGVEMDAVPKATLPFRSR
ncbi:hypothetical protein CFO_g4373 [Ceratocystis platani]|uniref:Protein MON2 n=1 Tax=Ceratocystis fimbriata f. sp. platani TaxID=88771 RepID=A0A0F8AYB8_CERFI|nr:hypothetical protein CFO_g4373 [Ceratocystis platani]